MALSPAIIRQRAAAALQALEEWHEVPHPYGLESRTVPEVRHLGFAVGVPESIPVTADTRQRTRPSRDPAVWVATTLIAVWYYRLRTEGEVEDYDGALTAELDALAAIRGMAREDMTIPVITRIERVVQSDPDSIPHLRTEVRATVHHVYPLS